MAARKPWSDEKILRVAGNIDQANNLVGDLVREIQDVSGHPLASEIAAELMEECVALASATQLVRDILDRAEG